MNQISMQMTNILSALAGAERIFQVMDTKPEIDEGSVTLVPAQRNDDGTLRAWESGGSAPGPGRCPRRTAASSM